MPSKGQSYFFLALLLVVGVFVLYLFWPYFNALILALTITVLFQPLYGWFLRAMPNWRGLAAVLTLLVVVVVIFAPLFFFGNQIFQESRGLYERVSRGNDLASLNKLANRIEVNVQRFYPGFDLNLREIANAILNWLVDHFGAIFSSVAQGVLTFFLSILAAFFMLKDGPRLRAAIISLSPLLDRYDRDIFDKLKRAVNSVIRGSLLIALIQGILTTVGFWVFGIPNPYIWGSLAVITALIPNLGTSLVIVPGIVYLLLSGNFPAALGLALWGLLAVGMIDNFLGPKFIEHGVSIHPFLILLSVLGGISFFGPIGFLAGPLLLSFLFALLDIYRDEFKDYISGNIS